MTTILTRRESIIAAAASIAGLAGLLSACANQANVDAQIVADVNGLEAFANQLVTAFQKNDPNAISAADMANIQNAEATVNAALAALSAQTPINTGEPLLQKIEDGFTTAFNIISAALPVAAAAFPPIAALVPEWDAAMALLPVLVAYVNTLIAQLGQPAPASARPLPKAIHEKMTPAQARQRLGIPTV